ncbi:MAG: 2-oxo-4-hydroxy-4-carboxy-5-ureidoimidazoline decarboxylase [Verrucomicrobia bacterium]|nr:2-oxo-4-hydroxy-4-carboxy-5-ureidoimidazoline decarboxylase [Verrucomicrobiota bacterium]
MTIAELNALPKDEFIERLGGIFEHSPWVAQKVVGKRPFRDREHLFKAMTDAVRRAGAEKQLELIRAHPDLVGKAAKEGKLSASSQSEQTKAGLTNLSAADIKWFDRYNRAYQEKYEFPLIVCLRALQGDPKQIILDQFEIRMCNDEAREKRTALEEINKIAEFRLQDLVG